MGPDMSERTIQDELLGELTWKEDIKCWDDYFEIHPNQLTHFILSSEEDPQGLTKPSQDYRHTLDLIQREDVNLRRRAAEELLNLYNDVWREDENEIDLPTFVNRIAMLDGIILYKNGVAEIFYQDDDLFASHAILVRLDEQGPMTALLSQASRLIFHAECHCGHEANVAGGAIHPRILHHNWHIRTQTHPIWHIIRYLEAI